MTVEQLLGVPRHREQTNDTESLPRRKSKSTQEVKTSKTSPTRWFHTSKTIGQAGGRRGG